ncbi:phosphatidylinositol 3-kinase, root isoform [Iris pallida]|uniref:Phosphatidylinositol 3-kinase, root isoform n=1 Tax=Iris pallida TaxID=29817 RepID=A0AAX6HP74_IRIPA|nr:phosphatidylinositol 3-kinase, root isoform [Iris pallida]
MRYFKISERPKGWKTIGLFISCHLFFTLAFTGMRFSKNMKNLFYPKYVGIFISHLVRFFFPLFTCIEPSPFWPEYLSSSTLL